MKNNEELRKKIEEIVLTVHGKDCYRGTACGYIEDAVKEFADLIHQEQTKLIEEIKDKLEKAKEESDKRNYNEEYEDGIDDALIKIEELKKTL